MQYTTEQIYTEFLKAKEHYTNKRVLYPKNNIIKTTPKNIEKLIEIRNYFNTKWYNVMPYKYFLCGFLLYKSFGYDKFFKNDIIKYYIQIKHNENLNNFDKGFFEQSFEFVKNVLKTYDKELDLYEYVLLYNNKQPLFLEHFLKGYINKYFVVYLIHKLKDIDYKRYNDILNGDYSRYLSIIIDNNNFNKYKKELIDNNIMIN